MKLGRLLINDRVEFAASLTGDHWFYLSNLGVEASTTAEAIQQDGLIRGALESPECDPAGGPLRFVAPIVAPEKMFGVGHNYMDHILESDATPPEEPVVFAKFPSSLNDPFGDVLIDETVTTQVDYEVELAVVVGRPTRAVPVDAALEYVYGFAVANDVSARDLQMRQRQIAVSKSCDTFCPIGPWITTADEIVDPQSLRLTSQVNGETRQDSNTSEMIFSAARLIEYISRGMTLKAGDIILTGTPHGVGFRMDPPRYLRAGDAVRCEIEHLGAIENRFRTGQS